MSDPKNKSKTAEMRAHIENLLEMHKVNGEALEVAVSNMAHMLRHYHQQLVREGFSNEEALHIVITRGLS